ncbi:ABC transporter substrate-binding protein [Parendozoicomonas haliclonae]|uniref:Heme-binding protein A n=1 Tax=Parendozoicomonas haliclonae TaxID=1960125 RepID=A0A1X7AI58_9GAMM|nr:ABC transporter substrate-binding protein [Parendozoicomonas haliclonae]SMA44208.1 Heme-binding protein A precursor [Parendozoicomonas haliclonae]
MKCRNLGRSSLLGATLLLLSACSDDPWNRPLPPDESGQKVYYSSYTGQPKHLDPVRAYSSDEGAIIDQIYDTPLQYHFLKRPYELEPSVATSMPLVEMLDENLQPLPEGSDAKPAFSRYTITIKSGIKYQPHPAFAKADNGQPLYFFNTVEQGSTYKELKDFEVHGTDVLTSDDFIYTLKRMSDPANKAPLIGLMSGYIVGMTELTEKLKADRKEDQWLDLRQYELEGVQKVDDHTYSILLKGTYPQFKYWLAFRFFAPVPWEADRFYHNPGFKDKNLTLDWNPIGTGPFMMTSNKPKREIILERNPNYREDFYPSEGMPDDVERGYLADAGKRLPFIDKAIFSNESSSTSQWSKFMQGYYDRSGETSANVTTSTFDQAFSMGPDGLELTPAMANKNIKADEELRPSINYLGFNMMDPVVGGYTEEKRKLRHAISIAWDSEELIQIFLNGMGQQAHSPVPPGLFGYRDGKEGMNPYIFNWNEATQAAERKSLEEAKQLLAEAGYPNGRDKDTGKPLILYMDYAASDSGPVPDWYRQQLKKLGIQLEFRTSDYPRFKEKMRQGNTQIFPWGWLADYPDPENFLFLLDSRQGSLKCECDGSNSSNYDNPRFDALYDRMKEIENGPERQALIDEMIAIAQKDSPWIYRYHRGEVYLSNEWTNNTKKHGISMATLKYVNVDPEQRAAQQMAWNKPNLVPLVAGVFGLIALVIPALRAFRRRQRLTIETDS